MKILELRSVFVGFFICGALTFCLPLHAAVDGAVQKRADMVVFSYNRPLQLYALLESLQLYMTGLGQVQIIYRASDEHYARAYVRVQSDFPTAIFTRQGDRPREDFKPLTLEASFQSPNEYIIYAVDDIVVKDFIDLGLCIDLLEKTQAWGFYFRLGANLSECYPYHCRQAVPPYTVVSEGVLSWHFAQGSYDWNYPHSVDMTLYCKSDIENDVRAIGFAAPNSFEGAWASRRPGRPYGLCYEQTKIVNLPLNRVQNENANRAMNFLTPAELLERFEQGQRMNIFNLFKVANKGAHMEYAPVFVGL